jgi:hypothetical protein
MMNEDARGFVLQTARAFIMLSRDDTKDDSYVEFTVSKCVRVMSELAQQQASRASSQLDDHKGVLGAETHQF